MVLADNHFPDFALPICRAARERNIPVVLDVDKPATEASDPLLAHASHAIFSAEALRAAAGVADLPEALARASTFCRGFVAATDGAAGALWHDGKAVRRQAAFAVVAADTLAAGDVFPIEIEITTPAKKSDQISELTCRADSGGHEIGTVKLRVRLGSGGLPQ